MIVKPMLAHKYAPNKVRYPCHVQPKLNGVRGIYVPGGTFQSRYGEIWNRCIVDHALSALSSVKFYLDGEFYYHGMSLQQINSRIGVVRQSPHVDSAMIQFHVFDVMVNVPFYKREVVLSTLSKLLADEPAIKFVDTREIVSEIEGEYWYRRWKNDGYEGMMYRESNANYGFEARCGNKENRWNYILKRKEMVDLTATIVGFRQMKDSNTGELKDTLGSFDLLTSDGIPFNAGSGLTDYQRKLYWGLGIERMRGVEVRILYEMFSDSGTPLKPIIDLVEFQE